jgi:hypothetical protein
MATPLFIPVTEGSLRLALSREQLIRRIQRGTVRGALRQGRWVVDARDVARLVAEREAERETQGVGAA